MYRFENLAAFRSAFARAEQELELPGPDPIHDGEWLLATFEVGGDAGHRGGGDGGDLTVNELGAGERRATAAAARGEVRENGRFLHFETRDWERLRMFGAAPSHEPAPPSLGRVTLPDIDPPTPRPSEVEAMAIPLVRKNAPSEPAPPASAVPDSLMAVDTLRPPPPPTFVPSNAPGNLGARILIVDDDPDVIEVVATMLETVGLATFRATTAEQALELVQSAAFDLVVLDWSLPGMSGLELCRRIRHHAALAPLPVLFLSGHSSTTDVVDAFASGADDFVVKPFRAPELGARIFALLRRARMTAAV